GAFGYAVVLNLSPVKYRWWKSVEKVKEGRKDKKKVGIVSSSEEEFDKIVMTVAEVKAGKDAVAEFFLDNSRSWVKPI
ncbi:unnamed protein product, partial [marine sediment metagenome]